jgi:tight adherence protein B
VTAPALACLAASLLVLRPVPYAETRLRAAGMSSRRTWPAVAVVLPRWGEQGRRRWLAAAVLGGLVGGIAVGAILGDATAAFVPGLAAAICAGVAAYQADAGAVRRRDERALLALGRSTGTLAAELRAGQQPGAALHAAGEAAAEPGVAALFAAAARTAADGGDVAGALRGAGGDGLTSSRPAIHVIAAGWDVSARTGAPLAAVLDRVDHDLRSRLRQRRQVAAQLAGPRATALLLAALPVLGILLGTAMGANPVRILLGTSFGQVLLLTGAVLQAAGVLWTARIVGDGGEPP